MNLSFDYLAFSFLKFGPDLLGMLLLKAVLFYYFTFTSNYFLSIICLFSFSHRCKTAGQSF